MANRKKPPSERPVATLQVPLNEAEALRVDELREASGHKSRAEFGYDMVWRGINAPKTEAMLYLTVPCGPWDELKSTNRIALDDALVAALGFKRGDFFAATSGNSMAELGIPDNSVVLLRPNLPLHTGDVVLWEAELPDGRRVGTLKKYSPDHNGTLRLKDGKGKAVEMPVDSVELRVAGVKRGLISRDR